MKKRPAFTLLEVVLVLALIVVVLGMIYPNLDAMYRDYKLTAAGDQVRAAWSSARAHAMDEGRSYRFAVVPGTRNFRVAPDSPGFWSGGNTPDSAKPALIREGALPKSILFATPDGGSRGSTASDSEGQADPGQYSGTVIVFLPDGTTREDARLTLTLPGLRPLILEVRALTGLVTTKREAYATR